MRLPPLALPLLLLPVLGRAAAMVPAPIAPPLAMPLTGTIEADYSGLAKGLKILSLRAEITLLPETYLARVAARSAGMVGLFVHNDSVTTLRGRFTKNGIMPERSDNHGELRGEPRETHIVYRNGNPVPEILIPPADSDHTPVDVMQIRGAVDTLAAMLDLMRLVARQGRCDVTVKVFDGRRLADVSAVTVGHEIMPPNRRSIFSGDALHCDFVSRQIGGFLKGDDEAALRAAKPGAVWLASVLPGTMPIPVRFDFEDSMAGQISLYLTDIEGGAVDKVPPCCTGPEPEAP
jgi:hypothetical protein